MEFLGPNTYLIGLIVLLLIVALIVGRQFLRVRSDEMKLINLEKGSAESSKEASQLYELASVQLKKRLYPQAVTTLRQASKKLKDEPLAAKALMENAPGFALAAQDYLVTAVKHYQMALAAKNDYPVALNNLAFAKEKLNQTQDSIELYQQVLAIEPKNKTALKQIKKLQQNPTKKKDEVSKSGFS